MYLRRLTAELILGRKLASVYWVNLGGYERDTLRSFSVGSSGGEGGLGICMEIKDLGRGRGLGGLRSWPSDIATPTDRVFRAVVLK